MAGQDLPIEEPKADHSDVPFAQHSHVYFAHPLAIGGAPQSCSSNSGSPSARMSSHEEKEREKPAKQHETTNEELTTEDQQHDELSKWELPCWPPVETKRLLAVQAILDAIHGVWDRRTRQKRPERRKEPTTKSEPSADEEEPEANAS